MIVAVNPSPAHRPGWGPGKKRIAQDVLIVREQACCKLRSRSFLKGHPNLVLRSLPFRRSQSDSQLLFIPKQGKGISMSTKLYVGNLAFQTTSQELQQLFARAGKVQSASVV